MTRSEKPSRFSVSACENRFLRIEVNMSFGTIVQCIGAVVDIEFPREAMPRVYDALVLEVDPGNKLVEQGLTFEVEQQLGDGVVRTIAMGSSDGLKRGMKVRNTGDNIQVPVGPACWTGDGRARSADRRARPDPERGTTRHPPARAEVRRAFAFGRAARDGIKVIDLICPFAKGGKIGCSAAPAWVRR